MKRSAFLTLSLLILGPAVMLSAGPQIPVAVSPGAGSGFQHVADTCATFSWAGVENSTGYTLAVYEVTDGGQLGQTIIRQALPVGASSWTIPAGRCLSRGMAYAWTVGAMGKKATVAWSEPVLFRVAAGPTETEFQEALAVVQSYLAAQEPPAGSVAEVKRDASPEPESDQPEPTDATLPLLPSTALSVDGGVEATLFTGDGSGLTSVDADTLDGTDGADFSTDAELTSALSGHFGSNDHDGRYYTETELSTSGGGATVHWTNLSSKPAGLDDGDDDTTCNGAACDGTSFTNVTAVAGDSATSFFSTGRIEEAHIADEIARDSELSTLDARIDALETLHGISSQEPLPYITSFEATQPQFEQTAGAGTFSKTPPAGTNARTGISVITTTSITTSFTGREIQSVACIGLNNDSDQVSATIFGVASTANGGNVISGRLRALWFTDALCSVAHSTPSSVGGGTTLAQGTYTQIDFSGNPPAGATAMKIRFEVHDDNGAPNNGDDWAGDDVSVAQ